MSFAIQISQQAAPPDEALFAEEFLPVEEDTFQESYSSKGSLTTPSKSRTCEKQPSSPLSKQMASLLEKSGFSTGKMTHAEKGIFSLAQSFSSTQAQKLTSFSTAPRPSSHGQTQTSASQIPAQATQEGAAAKLPLAKPADANQKSPLLDKSKNRPLDASKSQEKQTKQSNQDASCSLLARRWTQEDTLSWWQKRDQDRDSDKGGHQHQQQDQEEESGPHQDKKITLDGAAKKNISASTSSHAASRRKKPLLPAPKLGVFALYYILTKMGVFSDGAANFAYKKEIEVLDSETTETHQKRLKEMKEAIEKERSATRWSITLKVFSWIGSLFGIISGVAMVVTGVGAVAGAMLIAGGVIQITNQILEVSGGWHKIAECLPGDSSADKKRAVISWMQIGISVLCLILSAVGIIWGGFKSFGEGMQIASAMIGGIAAMGHGIATIGEGVSGFMYKTKLGEVRRYDALLAGLKHRRHDLMEKMEWGVERLEQLFEDLATSLEFDIELFRADQMINRR